MNFPKISKKGKFFPFILVLKDPVSPVPDPDGAYGFLGSMGSGVTKKWVPSSIRGGGRGFINSFLQTKPPYRPPPS
jgi:hypothetical protein